MVPGWRNSEPAHWQSLWEARLPGARRVVQDDWLFPRRASWVTRLSEAILDAREERVVLVAHSLGCMAVAHLAPEVAARVDAALLVAP
ncbi:alpha/beta hydrolase, partial [Arthrospira platensis SPKY1]|nr:alpha/beta hydrolase [Arthrospira platensis SPKY1]